MADPTVKQRFLRGLPKAELHVHVEGTLEPEMMLEFATRNSITTRFASVEELRGAYQFGNLQEFLDIYYETAGVLQTEHDFHDMTLAYLRRAAADGVRRAEIFFDPQTHTDRGVPFGTVIEGISAARIAAELQLGISSDVIMCFLRHLPAEAAMHTFEMSIPFREHIIGVGLDSSEVGYPPELFADVFDRAASDGLHRVAHAGEEGPPEYVWSALDALGAERIDHGVRALEDAALVERLVAEQTPLTVCPFSNVRLGGFSSMAEHPLAGMLEVGLNVSINSDDPAYFGGYIGDNYVASAAALSLGDETMAVVAANSIRAAFLPESEKAALLADLNSYVADSAVGD